IRVQNNSDGILTDSLQCTVRQADLALDDGIKTSAGQTISDIQRANGTEQTAVNTGLLDQGQSETGQLFASCLSGSQFLGLGLLQLGTACFEFLDGGSGGTTSDTLREQVVTGIPVAHPHDSAKVAEVDDPIEDKQ